MAKLCPICRKNRLTFGGMALKDGAFCSSCYDRIVEKSSKKIEFDKLMTSDLIELVNNKTDSFDFGPAIAKLLKEREESSKKAEPMLEGFRASHKEFFAKPGIEENASLQSTATQLLWHRLLLQKQRLNSKAITLCPEINRSNIIDVYPVFAKEYFDGKYDFALVRESIEGSNNFYKNEVLLHKQDKLTAARYRILSTHEIGKGNIVCSSCGKPADRDNLLDGCDYCGTKFTIEDLGSRVSEYRLERDISIEANQWFDSNSEYTYSMYFGYAAFALGVVATIFNLIIGEVGLVEALLMIPGSAIFAFLLALVFFFVYSFIKVLMWVVESNAGIDQISQRYKDEKARRGDVLERIKEQDPLFSAEGFYSELDNMLAALYYADSVQQISAFWDRPEANKLQKLLDSSKNVINMEIKAAALQDYFVREELQHIKVKLQVSLLEEINDKVSSRNEVLQMELVKAADCKTEAVCSPSLLRCKNCGASLSLMEGCHCHYCGNDAKLSRLAWAFKEIVIQG